MKTLVELNGLKGKCPKAERKWDVDTKAWFCNDTGKYCILAVKLGAKCPFYDLLEVNHD